MQDEIVLRELLELIRQHPGFPVLLKKAVGVPSLKPFRRSEAAKADETRIRWIFDSGRISQHEAWLSFLTGEPPQGDNDLREKE